MIRWLLVVVLALILMSGLTQLLRRFGFGRLPGDFEFRAFGRNWVNHSPLPLVFWDERLSTMAVTRARYQPALYDDERQRARSAPSQTRPAVQPGSAPAIRTGSQG